MISIPLHDCFASVAKRYFPYQVAVDDKVFHQATYAAERWCVEHIGEDAARSSSMQLDPDCGWTRTLGLFFFKEAADAIMFKMIYSHLRYVE